MTEISIISDLIHQYEDQLIDKRTLFWMLQHLIGEDEDVGDFSDTRKEALDALLRYNLGYSDKDFIFFEQLVISDRSKEIAIRATKVLIKYFKIQSTHTFDFLLTKWFSFFSNIIENLTVEELKDLSALVNYPITRLYLLNYSFFESISGRLRNKNTILVPGDNIFIAACDIFKHDYASKKLVKNYTREQFFQLEKARIEMLSSPQERVIVLKSYRRKHRIFKICCLHEDFERLFNLISDDNVSFGLYKHNRRRYLFIFFKDSKMVVGFKCFRAAITGGLARINYVLSS